MAKRAQTKRKKTPLVYEIPGIHPRFYIPLIILTAIPYFWFDQAWYLHSIWFLIIFQAIELAALSAIVTRLQRFIKRFKR
jgi:hypothetical protein